MDSHLTLESLAKWLSGRMEHEEVLRDVVPHLLARCPECRRIAGELERLKEEVGHPDEMVAALEWPQAPELLAELERLPWEEQVQAASERDDFHAWGLCQLLLKRSREAALNDPSKAVDLANLAVQIVAHLGEAYDPNWVLDLRARAFAYLGNARRVLGELRSADDAFRKAEQCLASSTTGNRRLEAEILDLKASLRRGQRRFKEALGLLDELIRLHLEDPENQDPHLAGRTKVSKAYTLVEMGRPEDAVLVLREAVALIVPEREPRLDLCLRHNLLDNLAKIGSYDEAAAMLPETRAITVRVGNELDLVRLAWSAGKIDLGLGRTEQAERAFRETQDAFFQRRMGYDAALVSLDLAGLLAGQGRTTELKSLASETLLVFEDREVQREAMVALLLFYNACQEESLTVELARQIADVLVQERGRKD